MATITLGPTGDFRHPGPAAYDALSGGITANVVQWQAGYSYIPDASTGRWWGISQVFGMDKRVSHVIVGGGDNPYVALDGRVHLNSGMVAVYTGANIWRVDVVTNASASALSSTHEVLFGAVYSDSASGVVAGWRYPPATSLANVSSEGLTKTGQRAGKGIWFSDKIGSTVRLHIWTPNGSSSRPEVQWGGIAATIRCTGSDAVGCSPELGAFCFYQSATNNPSGSSVTGDFRMYGAWRHHAGTPYSANQPTTRGVSDVTFNGIRMFGVGRYALFGSTAANGSASMTISNFVLTGDWTIDDLIDPALYQATPANAGAYENIQIESRVRDALIEGGRITVGLTHGVLSFVPANASSLFTGAGTEESRTEGVVARGIAIAARAAEDTYTRVFAVRAMYNTTLEGLNATGFSVPSKINGKGTLIQGCTSSLHNRGDDANDSALELGWTVHTMTTFSSATEDANLTCRYYGNTIDRRGDTSRNVIAPFSALEMRSYSGDTLPAGALDMQCNVFYGDELAVNTCAVRVKTHGTSPQGVVSPDQTAIRNFCATTSQASNAPNGVSTFGTPQTLATLFNTGVVSNNVDDTADNIAHKRGDRPAQPALVVSLAG